MRHLLNVCGIATAAIALATVDAQRHRARDYFHIHVSDVGNARPSLSEIERAMRSQEYRRQVVAWTQPVCRRRSTGTIIWEWDKTNGVLVSGNGVIRKPGSTVVFRSSRGKSL